MASRWKQLERDTAAALGGRRVTEPWFLFNERPDVVVPLSDGRRLVIDTKAHKRFAHHSMLEGIQRKYCQPGDVPCLVSKHERQTGEYATIPLAFLAGLLKRNHEEVQTDGHFE
jgi:hypothetical protein